MSSSIEERVVKMQFDNKTFEVYAKQTQATLDALNKSLQMTGATKGLENLDAAAKGVSLDHVGNGIQSLVDKFHTLSIVGITALTNIVNKAVNAGLQLTKSLTISPIKTGLTEYETNLNSIQTILANTGLEGEKGLKRVTDALDELNHYSDQTIYNFSEMARNIGTFTAAGVSLDVATEAIKGIANLAAVSGSNAQQASTAMYQLSQAISAGKVSLEDWNSVVNAGMGGKVFQNALMETARVHGVAIDKMVKDSGSFRLTLQEGWLTGEILTETLSKFTGDLTAGQLKTMGYNEQQIAGILKMGQTAQDAATKVKTMSQLIDTLQEGAVSGWAQTWALIFGDFDEAKTLFTNVNNVLGGFISKSSEARNSVIEDWKELGGRTSLIYAIQNAFNALIAVLTPIKQAFRQIFPATTGEDLMRITTAIRMFTEKLLIGGETAQKIQRTFAGLFAVLAIGWDIVKAVVSTIFDLLGVASGGAGGFLEFTASIGDFLVNLRLAIQQGQVIEKVFDAIGRVLKVPIELVKQFANYIGDLFSKFDAQDATKGVTGLVGKLSPLAKLGDALLHAWSRVPAILGEMIDSFWPFAEKAGNFFSNIGTWIADSLGGLDFTSIFAGAGIASLTSVFLAIRNLIGRIGGSGQGIFDSISDSFDQLNDTLGAMQNTLRAATLLQIAAAIAVMTIAVVALSKIDSDGLTRALTAITVMFTQMFTAMAVFEKFMGVSDIAELLAMGAALILIAIAIDILASAVKKLADLDWKGLAIGLTGVGALLAAVIATSQLMPNPSGLISTGAGLVILALAIKVLVSAVEDLSGLSWEELAKGLTGVGALLGALILFTKFADAGKAGVLQGAGIILLATGIKILASAVEDFSELSWMEIARGITAMAGSLAAVTVALMLIPPTAPLSAAGVAIVAGALLLIGKALDQMSTMSWMEIARGMTAMAGALVLIGAALILIPPSSILSAAAILVVASSLGMIADALKEMAEMSWEEIAKSLVLLAGALTIIAIAMYAMEAALPGALALLVVAASLAILAPILQMFGQMTWEEMGKGLLMLAGALTVIGVAGLLLTPVIPTLLGLGAAVLLLGIGMLAAGAGVLLFSIALTALSVSGVVATAALVGMVAALAGLIPLVLTKLGEGIVAFANVIATAGPAFTKAISAVLNALIDAIVQLTPKVIDTFFLLFNKLLNAIESNMPVIQAKGMRILISFLEGIRDNIGQVVTVASQIIVNFINAIAARLPSIIQAGFNLIISFVNGLANAIRSNQPAMEAAGNNLGSAIIDGITRGIGNGISKVTGAARNIAKSALNAAMSVLGINSPSKEFMKLGEYSDEGLALGLDKFAHIVADSATGVGEEAITSLKDTLSGMSDIVAKDLDTSPVIRPVLDLSDVQKTATQLSGMLAATPLSVDATYSSAKAASDGYDVNQAVADANAAEAHSEPVVFNQYNNSPKALSTSEIYRMTNNQLAKVKEVVKP